MLFPKDHVYFINLPLYLIPQVGVDVVGTEGIDYIFELPNFHKQCSNFLRYLVEWIVDQAPPDYEIQHVEMHYCQLIDIFILQFGFDSLHLLLYHSVE